MHKSGAFLDGSLRSNFVFSSLLSLLVVLQHSCYEFNPVAGLWPLPRLTPLQRIFLQIVVARITVKGCSSCRWPRFAVVAVLRSFFSFDGDCLQDLVADSLQGLCVFLVGVCLVRVGSMVALVGGWFLSPTSCSLFGFTTVWLVCVFFVLVLQRLGMTKAWTLV